MGLPLSRTSKEILDAHKEQQVKRAIGRMLRSKTPRGVKADVLLPKTPVYYYVRGNKQGEWKLGFVSKADEHLVSIRTKSDGRGHKMAIAHSENVRLVPSVGADCMNCNRWS